jgi:hypothetical protein
VSRLSFFFTTLIAAIPAAFLGYLCVMAFLLHSDALPPIMMGIAGITLLACVAAVAMPAAVLLKGRSKTLVEPKAKDENESEAVAEAKSGEVAVAEEEPIVAADDEDAYVAADADEFEDFDDSK